MPVHSATAQNKLKMNENSEKNAKGDEKRQNEPCDPNPHYQCHLYRRFCRTSDALGRGCSMRIVGVPVGVTVGSGGLKWHL
jgi:hypothetical protein